MNPHKPAWKAGAFAVRPRERKCWIGAPGGIRTRVLAFPAPGGARPCLSTTGTRHGCGRSRTCWAPKGGWVTASSILRSRTHPEFARRVSGSYHRMGPFDSLMLLFGVGSAMSEPPRETRSDSRGASRMEAAGVAPASARLGNGGLSARPHFRWGRRELNPHSEVRSLVSFRWTTSPSGEGWDRTTASWFSAKRSDPLSYFTSNRRGGNRTRAVRLKAWVPATSGRARKVQWERRDSNPSWAGLKNRSSATERRTLGSRDRSAVAPGLDV